MATIHLMCGFMGFGKTTLAKELERTLPAVRLTHDEFMVDLYGRNMPYETFHSRYQTVDDILWKLAEKIIATGTDVIMDYGFWDKKTRQKVQQKAIKLTPHVIWHQLNCDIHVAKKRVLKRTADSPNELYIDETCFDEKLKQYEPIKADECLCVIFHTSSGQ